jgi:8-oxo-dGTP diphosphatase / 2-hydroxy-dATP diphosphatase
MEKVLMTICMIRKGDEILLGLKKRGFGAGQWNGFGGKVNEGERIEEAAIRELKEESGLEAEEMSKRGIIEFRFQNDPKILEVHIFSIEKFNGMPIETEEMKPRWFKIKDIPYDKMWSDDKFWLPLFLAGKKFKGDFLFDQPSTKEYSAKIIEQKLIEVDEI